MDLSSLERFRLIAEKGSLTAAARALGCAQPTLSAMVQRLEEHYGTTLLLRTSRGIELTTTGEVLLAESAALFDRLDAIEQIIAGLEDGEVGRFVVGCNDSLGAYFLPGFLPGFCADAPRIEITLWNGTSAEVRQKVIDREVQFGLVVNPAPHPDLVMVELFRDAVDLMVTAPADDAAAARARLRMGPIVYAERLPQAQAYLAFFEAEGIAPARLLPCSGLELVKSFGAAGHGVAILPRRVAQYGRSGLVRLHRSLPSMPDRIVLLYRGDIHRTRAAMRLKDALVEHGRAMDADYDES